MTTVVATWDGQGSITWKDGELSGDPPQMLTLIERLQPLHPIAKLKPEVVLTSEPHTAER